MGSIVTFNKGTSFDKTYLTVRVDVQIVIDFSLPFQPDICTMSFFALKKTDKTEKHEISVTRKTFYKSEFVPSVYKNTYCGKIKIKTSCCTYLSGVEVDKAVAPWLSLQRPGLMKQEVKLFHIAKLLQQLHQVIPAERERAQKGSRTTYERVK